MLLEPHRGLHARGADREQHRARPRRLRRPRSQHLRDVAALPGRDRVRLLEPRHRPGRLHPRARRGQAVRRRSMRESLLEPLGMERSTFDRARDPVDDRIAPSVTSSPIPELPLDVPMTAAGGLYASADGPGAVPPLRAERRLDRRPDRARSDVAGRDADDPAAARRAQRRVRARRRPTPLERWPQRRSLQSWRRRVRVPRRPVVGARSCGIGIAILTNSTDHISRASSHCRSSRDLVNRARRVPRAAAGAACPGRAVRAGQRLGAARVDGHAHRRRRAPARWRRAVAVGSLFGRLSDA